MNIRKKYSKEFKIDAIILVAEKNHTLSEAASELNIHKTMLGRWIKEYQLDARLAFRGNGKLTSEQLEIRRSKWRKTNRDNPSLDSM